MCLNLFPCVSYGLIWFGLSLSLEQYLNRKLQSGERKWSNEAHQAGIRLGKRERTQTRSRGEPAGVQSTLYIYTAESVGHFLPPTK